MVLLVLHNMQYRGACVFAAVTAATIVFVNHNDASITAQAGILLNLLALHRLTQHAVTMLFIDLWPGVAELDPWTQEFQEQVDFFTASCLPWCRSYDFQLHVNSIFRVGSPTSNGKRGQPKSHRHLFHGTSRHAARNIVSTGFRLPNHPGMFGKGIYFADCPLKSWRYAADNLSDPYPCACNRRVGLILSCSVDLGQQRQAASAEPTLQGYNRRSWWAWLTGQYGAYDSVVGLDKGRGGTLRVPEYVIYDPRQAKTDYIFVVTQLRS